MSRPIIIDWFCGEGGASQGYYDAGFEPIGVDINPQPRYPFTFFRADCIQQDGKLFRIADAHHASPPCQFGTELNSDKGRHLNLIPQTRKILKASGKPYTIENVRAVRAHLIDPVSLFGTMFGNRMVTSKGVLFSLSRERLFETNWGLEVPKGGYDLGNPIANVFGGHLRARSGEYRTGNGTGKTVDFPGEDRPALARELMGMPWASMNGMSEAVPPSYTRFIGDRLMDHLEELKWAT